MSGDVGEYCREIEAHLCRKNDGHLVRIVGPAFEKVCGWAAMGVPLAVARRGIDRTFERYYRKGPRRRPVQVEFCEADVLDAFDEWRRAVGVVLDEGSSSEPREDRRESLPGHLRRVAERLSSLTAVRVLPPDLLDAVDHALREISAMTDSARALRGQARDGALDRLRALDRELAAAALAGTDAATLADLGEEAARELAPFAGRMPAGAYDRAVEAARDRLLRDRLELPMIAME
ncbi:MAG TPA: hypothetical protein VHJ77_09015 [Vicinamibacterales bacterium]|jgi:hypothetical protein|nr:hypothetical protein [Vicinamibacterales bacterium]